MSRLDSIIARVESGEEIDPERESLLQSLDLVKMGEDFKDEMLSLYESCNDLDRYPDLEEMEFYPSGLPKLLRLKNRNIETVEYYENGAVKKITTRKEPNGG